MLLSEYAGTVAHWVIKAVATKPDSVTGTHMERTIDHKLFSYLHLCTVMFVFHT